MPQQSHYEPGSTQSATLEIDDLADGSNQYLYNADGQICAVHNMTGWTEYIYDAEGRRVAEGSINTQSCDTANNGFTVTANYVRDQAGHQLSEFTPGQSGTMVWQHTNVYANGELIATEDNTEAHFYLNDWLGTRRVQTDYLGVPEQTCSSLPYGDAETCAPTPTENLFTGKERDAESGNDYFGARYYASTMGRFLSPDPSQLYYADPANPQSFNLYGYVANNPLTFTDPSGLDACAYDEGDGTATIYNATDGGAVDCPGNGFYITTTQQVDAVGFNENGDLSIYGADGNLYNADGSSYVAAQTVTVGADGNDSFIPTQTIFSPATQYIVSRPAQHSFSPTSEAADVCAASALLNNGVALSLDGAGFIPGESQAVATVQGGIATASFVNSMNHSDAKGAELAYTGGLVTTVGALAKQSGFIWAKAIPFVGYGVNIAATLHDLGNAMNDYEECMSEP